MSKYLIGKKLRFSDNYLEERRKNLKKEQKSINEPLVRQTYFNYNPNSKYEIQRRLYNYEQLNYESVSSVFINSLLVIVSVSLFLTLLNASYTLNLFIQFLTTVLSFFAHHLSNKSKLQKCGEDLLFLLFSIIGFLFFKDMTNNSLISLYLFIMVIHFIKIVYHLFVNKGNISITFYFIFY